MSDIPTRFNRRLIGIGGGLTTSPTGSPEAVTHLRLPQNVASGFPARRSSECDAQHSQRLQRPGRESPPRSLQRQSRLPPVEDLPRDTPWTASTAQPLGPVPLHGAMHVLPRTEVPGNAGVGRVTAQHLLKVAPLLLDWDGPHASHQVAEGREAALEACLLRTQPDCDIARLVPRAIERTPQRGNGFWTPPPSAARVPLGTSPALDERGLGQCQCEAKLPQPLAQRLLDPQGIRPKLAAHHNVVEVPHPRGCALEPGLHQARKPQVKPVVQGHIPQPHADRPPLRGPCRVRMALALFQHARFPPPSSQAEKARIADSVCNKAAEPSVVYTPKAVLPRRLQPPLLQGEVF